MLLSWVARVIKFIYGVYKYYSEIQNHEVLFIGDLRDWVHQQEYRRAQLSGCPGH